jgi:hypothetical protein
MVTRIRPVPAALCLVLTSVAALAAQENPKLDRLIVYGKDFAFSVKEPAGWHGDTAELARKYDVNVVFVPSTEDSVKHNVTIRVRVNDKEDENTIEDLNYDMQQYKKEFPQARFQSLAVNHPEYKTFAKVVYVTDHFFEYVAYLNPGSGKPIIFSVAMSKQKAPATSGELEAHASVLKSVQWLTSSVTIKP